MYSFVNDYSEGAHPRIMEAMVKTNLEQTSGYSTDYHTENAKRLIKKAIDCDDVNIHILVGGTQTNAIAISSFLRPHQAAIGVDTAHINVHETGAIEATGHKVLTAQSEDGKLKPEMIQKIVNEHTDEHMVQPKLVYISNSTEIGTIYKLDEIKAIKECCNKNNLLLFLDGARLGVGLTSKESDVKLSDLPKLCDAFYIGGTKNGALFGEALVICNNSLNEDFRFLIKQKGAMLAKGRLLGIQFEELFKDDLYFELARHANKMAILIKNAISEKGYKFKSDSSTNQQFPILPNDLISGLEEKFSLGDIIRVDDKNSSIRIVTSWATDENIVYEFIKIIKKFDK